MNTERTPVTRIVRGDTIVWASGVRRVVAEAQLSRGGGAVTIRWQSGGWHVYRATDIVARELPARCWCGRRLSTLPDATGDYCAEHDEDPAPHVYAQDPEREDEEGCLVCTVCGDHAPAAWHL